MDILKSTENILPKQASNAVRSSSTTSSSSGTKQQQNTLSSKSSTIPTTTKNSNSYPQAQTFECNFDKDPTKLYLSIQRKQWEEAISSAKSYPQESKIWVSRYEDTGKLRWRLLPLHAAIIFKATEETVEALLFSYPRASRHKDDQGMLPLHLAIRNMSSARVVQLLLLSYPEAANVQDRKGRLPLALVENMNCATSVKDRYKEVLQNAQTFHDVVSAAVESDIMHNFRKKAVSGSIEYFDAEKINLVGKIDALEADLSKTQQARDILIGRVNSLEAKLSSKDDTESYLTTRISNIDTSLKEALQAKEVMEAQLASEKKRHDKEKDELRAQCEVFKAKIQELQGDVNKATVQTIETELSSKQYVLADQIAALQKEKENYKNEIEQMEILLQQKIESENSLANQVSALASRLAESTAGTCASTSAFQKRIETLVQEKAELKKTVDTLTLKVTSVLRTLSFMAKEHDRILRMSMTHQDTLQTAKKYQDNLAANAARNEQMLLDAAWEREEIVRILTRQAQEVEKSAEERKKLMKIVKEQNAKIEQVFANRSELVGSIHSQKSRMASLKNDIQVLKQIASDDSSFLSEDDNDDVNTITPTVVRSKDYGHDFQEEFEALNQSSISQSEEASSPPDNSESYHEESVEHDKDSNSSTLTSSFEESSSQTENQNQSVAESSVDILCNEAARLVASMPHKK